MWSPDGRSIAFGAWTRDPLTDTWPRSAIYVALADGSNLRRLTDRPSTTEGQIAWSADGRFLAYLGIPDGASLPSTNPNSPFTDARHDVFVIGADGSGDQNVTSSSSFEGSPSWSPDGSALAFSFSTDGERYRLATVEVDGSGRFLSTARGPDAGYLVWSPDATALLLTGSADGGATVSIVGRDLEPRAPAAQFDGSILCRPTWLPVDH